MPESVRDVSEEVQELIREITGRKAWSGNEKAREAEREKVERGHGNNKKRVKEGWDKGLDYDEFAGFLKECISELYPPGDDIEVTQLAYCGILLTQLANGLRISEAIEAVREWCETGEVTGYVRVRKKRGQDVYRPVKIPHTLHKMRRTIAEVVLNVDERKLHRRIVAWASKHGWNTHSVRYAWITKKLKEGHNPLIVARAVRHSSADILMRYVQKKEADSLIEEDDL